MSKRRWLPISIFLLTSLVTSGQNKSVLSATEFYEEIKRPGIQLLDVRTSQEYNAGHISQSFQADWLNQQQFQQRVKYLDKEKPLYVYCGSGVRSNDAARWLRSNGFRHVFELQNGIVGWKKNKNPLESETAVKQVTGAEYKAMVDTSALVLVDFGAEWCPPCKKMEPVLDQLQSELRGKFLFRKMDAGIQTDIMEQLGVNELPTFVLYKNGKEVWRKTGLITLEELRLDIRKNF